MHWIEFGIFSRRRLLAKTSKKSYTRWVNYHVFFCILMNLRQYITIMLFATLLGWVAWAFVIFNVDPFQDSTLGFFFFYISLFFSLVGTCTLITFLAVSLFPHPMVPMYRLVQKSFRVGLLTSGTLTLLLFLQGKEILTKWNSILLLFIGVTITCFFLSTKYFVNKDSMIQQ